MGVDLNLLPMLGAPYCYTTLELNRARDLWPLIRELPASLVPQPFYTLLAHGDEVHGWYAGETATDANYSKPLMCVRAGDLRTLREHPAVRERLQNRAAWAYLDVLPDDTSVALYWY